MKLWNILLKILCVCMCDTICFSFDSSVNVLMNSNNSQSWRKLKSTFCATFSCMLSGGTRHILCKENLIKPSYWNNKHCQKILNEQNSWLGRIIFGWKSILCVHTVCSSIHMCSNNPCSFIFKACWYNISFEVRRSKNKKKCSAHFSHHRKKMPYENALQVMQYSVCSIYSENREREKSVMKTK